MHSSSLYNIILTGGFIVYVYWIMLKVLSFFKCIRALWFVIWFSENIIVFHLVNSLFFLCFSEDAAPERTFLHFFLLFYSNLVYNSYKLITFTKCRFWRYCLEMVCLTYETSITCYSIVLDDLMKETIIKNLVIQRQN